MAEPLTDDELALVKLHATAMIDDVRVASYVLRLADEHAALNRERNEACAKAWDEGYLSGCDPRYALDDNPYRKAPTNAR